MKRDQFPNIEIICEVCCSLQNVRLHLCAYPYICPVARSTHEVFKKSRSCFIQVFVLVLLLVAIFIRERLIALILYPF